MATFPKTSSDKLVYLFFCVTKALKQKLDLNSPLYQLPLSQIETLRFIDEQQSAVMKQVADFLAITPPSATVLINRLVKLGYVHRLPDKRDRRTIHLTLTKQGSKALRQATERRYKVYKKLLGKLNPHQQKQLLTILEKMIN